jgi:hypothetical protein
MLGIRSSQIGSNTDRNICTNTIINVIANDLLQCNKFYVVNSAITFKQPIHIVAYNEILWMKFEDENMTKFWDENMTH